MIPQGIPVLESGRYWICGKCSRIIGASQVDDLETTWTTHRDLCTARPRPAPPFPADLMPATPKPFDWRAWATIGFIIGVAAMGIALSVSIIATNKL